MSEETRVLLIVFAGLGGIAFLISFPFIWKAIDKIVWTKTKANIMFAVADVLCVWGLYYGYTETKGIITALHSNVEMIKLNNIHGFFILGLGVLFLHLLGIIEHFQPALVERNKRQFNTGLIVTGITLFAAAILFSFATRSIVKNKNYYRCSKLEGLSAFSSLVYTRDSQICKDQVEAETQRSLSAR